MARKCAHDAVGLAAGLQVAGGRPLALRRGSLPTAIAARGVGGRSTLMIMVAEEMPRCGSLVSHGDDRGYA